MNKRQKTYRLFFALWPSDQVRQSIVEQLSGLSPRLNGRVMHQQNLHVTVHVVGLVLHHEYFPEPAGAEVGDDEVEVGIIPALNLDVNGVPVT